MLYTHRLGYLFELKWLECQKRSGLGGAIAGDHSVNRENAVLGTIQDADYTNSFIHSINMTDTGSGYTTEPSITIGPSQLNPGPQPGGGDAEIGWENSYTPPGIDLSTSGGDIRVKLPSNFNADMELLTSGGDVSCNLTMNNASKLSDHKIIAQLNDGGYEFVAHTSGGDIDVRKK